MAGNGSRPQLGYIMKRLKCDADQVFKLAAFGLTYDELADLLDVSKSFLEENYSDIIREGKATMKMQLKRAMIKNAIDNENTPMQIHLDKKYGDFVEKSEVTQTIEVVFEKDNND